MNRRHINEVRRILMSGAPARIIARALNNRGYEYRVYGWDAVINGYYCEYIPELDTLESVGAAILCRADEYKGEFVYSEGITSKDVQMLKEIYL